MFLFRKNYLFLALLLFVVEVLIAVFVHDRFVRPYVGDFLVVILIYCFVRSFLNASVTITAVAVLVFSYAIEVAQYFKLVNLLGLEHSRLAVTVIGSSFAWIDLVAYTLGVGMVVVIENRRKIF